MKYIILLVVFFFGFVGTSSAQKEELKAAQTNIDAKEYVKALDNISRAKQAVSKLIADNLASVLPAKYSDFEMQEDNEMMGRMSSQGVSVSRMYKRPAAKSSNQGAEGEEPIDPMMMYSQPQIMVTITTEMMMAGEVMNAHSMNESQMGEQGTKALRIKGYRAILRGQGGAQDDSMMANQPRQESAQVIVGGAFVSVETQGFDEAGDAEKFANQIDFVKLKEIIGE